MVMNEAPSRKLIVADVLDTPKDRRERSMVSTRGTQRGSLLQAIRLFFLLVFVYLAATHAHTIYRDYETFIIDLIFVYVYILF